MTTEPLFSIFGLPVTAYALCAALAALLSALLLPAAARRARVSARTGETFLLLAVVLGAFCAHLLYCLVQLPDILAEYGGLFLLTPMRGGFMAYGAMAGIALAALLSARWTKGNARAVLDAALPSGALFLALCRFSEFFDGQGYGMQVDETPGLCFFPLSFQNEYGEWYLAIFLFEGLFALGLCLWAMIDKKERPEGKKTVVFLILYAASQTLFETLRRDQVIKWGFIRVSQLISVLLLAAILLIGQVISHKDKSFWRTLGAWLVFIVLTGACVGLEFTVDKPIPIGDKLLYLPYWLTYLLIGLCAAGMGVLAHRAVRARPRPRKG